MWCPHTFFSGIGHFFEDSFAVRISCNHQLHELCVTSSYDVPSFVDDVVTVDRLNLCMLPVRVSSK